MTLTPYLGYHLAWSTSFTGRSSEPQPFRHQEKPSLYYSKTCRPEDLLPHPKLHGEPSSFSPHLYLVSSPAFLLPFTKRLRTGKYVPLYTVVKEELYAACTLHRGNMEDRLLLQGQKVKECLGPWRTWVFW